MAERRPPRRPRPPGATGSAGGRNNSGRDGTPGRDSSRDGATRNRPPRASQRGPKAEGAAARGARVEGAAARGARAEGTARPARPRKPAGPAATAAPGAPGRGDRIAKLLARAGVGSRRDIERLIAEGRVALDGRVLDTPATILTSLKGVTVDGHEIAQAQATRIFLFHKPAGVLTAARDPSGRPTIYDVLPATLPRLVPVGRLDLNTEGLLLLTNDGELKRALELPASEVPRTYRVRALGEVRQQDLEALAMGVTLEGVRYGPVDASVDRRARADGANIWLSMTLTEGKNREVRKLCEAMGLKVNRLIRTAYGPFTLGELPVRGVEEVPDGQVVALKRSLSRARPRSGA